MSSMTIPVAQDLDYVLKDLEQLKRSGLEGRPKPHKLILFPNVVDLYESGLLTDNRVYLDEPLRKRFTDYCGFVPQKGDLPQVGLPFFHWRTSGLWRHVVREGAQPAYDGKATPGGGIGNVLRTVKYACLEDPVRNVLRDDCARAIFRYAIIKMLIDETPSVDASKLFNARYTDGS